MVSIVVSIRMRKMFAKPVFNWPLLKSEGSQSRDECVRPDLTRRLKHICENLSTGDFAALITKMTDEQLRSEGLAHRTFRPT